MNRRSIAIVAGAVLLGASGYAAYWYGMQSGMRMSASEAAKPSGSRDTAASGKIDPKTGRRVLYWQDPMVPGQRFDKPGKSPYMDMDLVPVYADDTGGEGAVSIDPRVAQNLGVRTADVEKGWLAPRIEAVGNVAYNERELVQVQARVGGFVERLHVRAPLDRVRKGDPLVDILAPEWVAAQEEYLALRRMSAPDLQLIDAARQRMRLVGMTEQAIATVESTEKLLPRATVYAPVGGVIAELGVREGMTVMAGATLFRINGLGSVWVNAEIPGTQAAGLKQGLAVEAKTSTYPGAVFKGRINALLPQVNQTTRTVVARIEIGNPKGQLIPGMFVTVDLSSAARREAILVPSEAVIQTGTRSIVVLALGEGKFRPVDVETGLEAGGRTEVRKGLEAGQKVVVSGQFLIDSEASLKGGMARMEGAPQTQTQAAGDVHHGEGKVVALTEQGVTLEHGPIASLQWAGMTMAFRNPPGGLPKGIAVGDRVGFDFRITQDQQVQLIDIRALEQHGAASSRQASR